MTLPIYLLFMIMFADAASLSDYLKIEKREQINHLRSWLIRALLALITALPYPSEGWQYFALILAGGAVFGGYFMVRLNLRRDLPWDYISSDPRGSKIDYAYWRLSKKFGGVLLIATYLILAVIGGIWYYSI